MIGRYWDLPATFPALAARAKGGVLLESSRPDRDEHTSLLFTEPEAVLELGRPEDILEFFAAAEDWLDRGFYLAGYVAYEAGYRFAELDDPPSLPYPLAVLGVYREPLRFDHLTGRTSGPPPGDLVAPPPAVDAPAPAGAEPSPTGAGSGLTEKTPAPRESLFGLEPDAYATAVERILEYLRAGDCYQINFTDAFELAVPTDLMELYLRVRRAQPTPFGAFLNLDRLQVASFSPELHFRVRDGTLVTRPMKGTSARGRTLAEDLERRAELAGDAKNRAENVMIVDLLRNDMGRLCRPGSIEVPRLFEVQPFGRVLQMTSTVRGELEGSPRLGELFAKLFPSGSVTGAPKRRAMEIVRELERRPRGVYTGAIGYAAPGGDMAFSVAIRTVTLSGGRAVLGAGSGIVIDSDPAQEYRECRLKAAFIADSGEPFDLLETMRLDAGTVCLQGRHLDRLRDSASYFGYPFDREEAEELLAAFAHERSDGVYRVRLALARDGRLELTAGPLAADPVPLSADVPAFGGRDSGLDGQRDGLAVALAGEPVDSSDPFLFHKTSRRARQDRALALARSLGLADLLFVNERGELTEGAVSNLFVEIGGRLVTPPVECGLLPGVGRARVLETHPNVAEAVIRPEALPGARAIYLCSALRGLRRVRYGH